MSEKTVRTVAIVMLVLVAVGAAAGITYYLQQRRVDQLSAQVRAKQAELVTLAAQIDRINARLQALSATDTATSDETTATEQPQEQTEPAEKPEPTTTRQSAFVRKATDKNGKMSLVLDFAQFLTGDAAAEAAEAAGDEPPPNDYYIMNSSLKLRTFPVDKKAKFVVAYGDPNDTATLSAGEFYDAIVNNTDGAADALYWFVIANGRVTGGEQQWLP
jgi:cell division protein FtsB